MKELLVIQYLHSRRQVCYQVNVGVSKMITNSFPTRIIRTDWYSSMIATLLKTQISPIWPSISRGHLVFHSGMRVRVFDDDASERKMRFLENHWC
jgi:hypothetical protein